MAAGKSLGAADVSGGGALAALASQGAQPLFEALRPTCLLGSSPSALPPLKLLCPHVVLPASEPSTKSVVVASSRRPCFVPSSPSPLPRGSGGPASCCMPAAGSAPVPVRCDSPGVRLRVEATPLPLPVAPLHLSPPVQASVNNLLWNSGCDALLKTHCRSSPVPTTATPMDVVILVSGVVGKSPQSTHLSCASGERLDPVFGTDDDDVCDVATPAGASSWSCKSL